MNLFSKPAKFLEHIRKDPLVTELRGARHRLAHSNGLMELSFQLSETERDAFNSSASALRQELTEKLDASTVKRNTAIQAAKALDAKETSEAHNHYEQELFKLFTAYGKLPSAEKLAELETPLGAVVDLSTLKGATP